MDARAKVCVMAAAMATAAGCAVQPDEADRFREAVPQQDEVALRVPGGEASSGARPQGLRVLTNGGAAETARYYRFTREITGAVDFGTAAILGAVWAIVHSPPTTIEAKRAVWGPGQANALEPAVWRFTVEEKAEGEYDYVLEGRPKAGGEFLTALRGHGYGKAHPLHRQGWFEADNDVFRTLDPANARDHGTTKVTYDLKSLPATIAVALRPGADRGSADVVVTHEAAGAGSVDITALGDIDDSKATKLEDVRLLSRWSSAGAGRADVLMKGGDLPTTVKATECWSESFSRVFYEDTVSFEPKSGDAAACAFPASSL